MTIGEKIRAARKRRRLTLGKLGAMVGLGISTLSGYEADQPKNGIDPDTLVKIADALNDLSILSDHCLSCPVRKHLFIKQFPDLNNIMDSQPAIIVGRLRKEMSEALGAAENLAERYSDKDFKNRPGYQEAFEKDMEQILDVQRAIEILTHQLVMLGVHSSKDIQKVYSSQQDKCVKRGHHIPDESEGASDAR